MANTRTCICGIEITIPIERIEHLEHLMNVHRGSSKMSKPNGSGFVGQQFFIPEDAWRKEPSEFACSKHKGEHPFFYKRSVGAYVTWCHEIYDGSKTYPERFQN